MKKLLSDTAFHTLQNALDVYYGELGNSEWGATTKKELAKYKKEIDQAEKEIIKLNK